MRSSIDINKLFMGVSVSMRTCRPVSIVPRPRPAFGVKQVRGKATGEIDRKETHARAEGHVQRQVFHVKVADMIEGTEGMCSNSITSSYLILHEVAV